MHTRTIILGLLFALPLCYGCGSKEQNTSAYSEYEKPDATSAVQQMRDYHYSAEVQDKSLTYTYDIVREANDTLPVVKGDDNTEYVDNYIRLRVNADGKEFFNKVFTKHSFVNYLDKDFIRHSILEGMAFDCLLPEGLRFSVSVSYPESDIYIPLSVIVMRNGSYKITKEDILDTVVEADSTKEE